MEGAISIIKKMYEKYPSAKEDFRNAEYETRNVMQLLSKLKKPLKDFSLESLDSYGDEDYGNGFNLDLALVHLPVKALINELGEHVAIWAWCHYPYEGHYKVLGEEICDITGRSFEMLEKARLGAWRLLHTSDGSTVCRLESLISSLSNGFFANTDLPSFLKASAKDGIQLSDDRISDYSLSVAVPEKNYEIGYDKIWCRNKVIGNKDYCVYLDATVGFFLLYKGKPNAVATFLPVNPDTLMIYQMQGINPKIIVGTKYDGNASARGLAVLDHQKFLVEFSQHIAREFGFKEIGILGGRNNQWTKKYFDGHIHLPLNEALVKYDKVAERFGFEQRKDKNWYKTL